MSNFQTTKWVCDIMVGLLPTGVSTVLEPTPGEGNLVRALNGYQVTAPREFWDVSGRFDAVVMNPPFTPMEQGYKILYAVMEMSDIIIALMPWLTLINSENRLHWTGLRLPNSSIHSLLMYWLAKALCPNRPASKAIRSVSCLSRVLGGSQNLVAPKG